jgi:hypothetical protein
MSAHIFHVYRKATAGRIVEVEIVASLPRCNWTVRSRNQEGAASRRGNWSITLEQDITITEGWVSYTIQDEDAIVIV